MSALRVRLPRLLNNSLGEIRRIRATAAQVTLQLTGTSEVTLTLPDSETVPAMHALVEVYTNRGSAGIFRVANIARDYRMESQVTLLHGIDTLSDSLWKAQETFTGTMTEYLTRLLSFQTTRINGAAPWQLGTCECSATIEQKEMNYDRLSNLWAAVEADETDFCFVYDQSSFPWTVSLVRKTTAITAGIRLRRNATGVTVTQDDSEMCNKLRLSANRVVKNAQGQKTGMDTVYLDYENAASQATWGVVEKVADIEVTEDIKAGERAQCDAWAAKFLRERAAPALQIEVEARELRRETGDPWDEPHLGEMARVDLPDYDTTMTERVVALTWEDALGDPEAVRVSMSNVLPRFSETLAQIRETARRAGGAAGRAATAAEISSYWDMIVREIEPAVTGTGIRTLWESGIILDAQSGVTIYSLMAGLEALNSVLKIAHTGVESLVTAGGVMLDEDGNLVLDENDNPVYVPGNNLATRITQNAQSIQTEVTNRQDADNTLSSRITQEADRISLVVEGTGSGATVKAASIVAAVNGAASTVKISADHVDVDGILTASGLITQTGYAGTIKASTLSGTTVEGGTVKAGTLQLSTGGQSYQSVSRNAYKIDGVTQNDTILMCGSSVLDIPATYIKTITKNAAGDTLTITDSAGTVTTFSKPQSVTLDDPTWGSGSSSNSNTFTVTASNGASKSQAVYLDQDSWANGSKYVYLSHTDSSASNRVARISVSIPTTWTWGSMGSGSGETTGVTKNYSVSKAMTYCWFTVTVGGLSRKVQIHLLNT